MTNLRKSILTLVLYLTFSSILSALIWAAQPDQYFVDGLCVGANRLR
jgi:hypothetical protein